MSLKRYITNHTLYNCVQNNIESENIIALTAELLIHHETFWICTEKLFVLILKIFPILMNVLC